MTTEDMLTVAREYKSIQQMIAELNDEADLLKQKMTNEQERDVDRLLLMRVILGQTEDLTPAWFNTISLAINDALNKLEQKSA